MHNGMQSHARAMKYASYTWKADMNNDVVMQKSYRPISIIWLYIRLYIWVFDETHTNVVLA